MILCSEKGKNKQRPAETKKKGMPRQGPGTANPHTGMGNAHIKRAQKSGNALKIAQKERKEGAEKMKRSKRAT